MSDASGGTMPHSLSRIFEPRSIAVVGASADPAKRGFQIVRALGESGYRGEVYPVNPKGGSLMGYGVCPSVMSLPEGVDLAVLCTPGAAAPELVRDLGTRGVAGVVVLAVGFGEAGAEGAALERELADAAHESGVRVIGPNTSGMLNLRTGANLIGARGVRPGGIALLVQSGNMALSLMTEISETTWDGISICLGVGNEIDLGFAEALDYLGTHEDTDAVIVYAEGFRNAPAFLDVASRVTRVKPVVMIKAARTERAARAALSHTGAVAGSYDRFRSALAQAGVVELTRTDELLHVTRTLAHQPVAAAETGVAILSDGGGQGTLAVDVLGEAGVPLARLSSATRERLSALLGPAAAVANPVDLAGAADGDPRAFAHALEPLVEDPAVGSVLVVGLFGGYGIRFTDRFTEPETQAAQLMSQLASRARTGLVVHSMYARHRSPPLEALERERVPVIASLDTASRCVAELHLHRRRLERPDWRPLLATRPELSARTVHPREHGERPALVLSEPEARALLAEHGLRFSEAVVVESSGDAADAAKTFGVPIAVKLVSSHIAHKTDVGGVALDVLGPDAARAAFESVTRAAEDHRRAQGLPGEPPRAIVTPMAAQPLAELLIGAYRDPLLGPSITVGAGGSWVEALRDVSHRLLPVEPGDVEAMLDELAMSPMLRGARGRPSADVAPIAATVSAVAECLVTHDDIVAVEVNPLFVYPDRVEAIDARVVRVGGEARPRDP